MNVVCALALQRGAHHTREYVLERVVQQLVVSVSDRTRTARVDWHHVKRGLVVVANTRRERHVARRAAVVVGVSASIADVECRVARDGRRSKRRSRTSTRTACEPITSTRAQNVTYQCTQQRVLRRQQTRPPRCYSFAYLRHFSLPPNTARMCDHAPSSASTIRCRHARAPLGSPNDASERAATARCGTAVNTHTHTHTCARTHTSATKRSLSRNAAQRNSITSPPTLDTAGVVVIVVVAATVSAEVDCAVPAAGFTGTSSIANNPDRTQRPNAAHSAAFVVDVDDTLAVGVVVLPLFDFSVVADGVASAVVAGSGCRENSTRTTSLNVCLTLPRSPTRIATSASVCSALTAAGVVATELAARYNGVIA
jgi:hypothetical protein